MKTRTITIKKKDIFFDIDKLSLSLAEASGENDVRVTDAVSSETATAGGTRAFTRLSDKRMADIRELLKAFITDVTQASGDDLIVTSDYVLALNVTDELPDSTLNAIIALIHDYIVKGALADWYTEIGKGPAANLLQLAADSYARIRELIYQRQIPTMS